MSDMPLLNLPDDWKVVDIPDLSALQAAAEHALHDINAFLIITKNDPQAIAAQLDSFAEILRAAVEVEGSHQEKVIRLALDLESYYWLNHGKVDAWVKLLVPMITHTLNQDLPDLRSRLFQSWGVYIYLTQSGQKPDASQNAFEAALDYAADSNRPDIRLLAEVEHLNLDSHDPRYFEPVKERAEALLKKAHELKYAYAQGRVYLSLANAYRAAGIFDPVFDYAQQALAIFAQSQHYGLAGQAVLYLLPQAKDGSQYRQNLLAYLNDLLEHSGNALLQSSVCQSRACQLYKQKNYAAARVEVLQSYTMDRINHYQGNQASNRHMLGLIQTELHHWTTARQHLNAALALYWDRNDQSQIVNLQHALAYIPLVQKHYPQAYKELSHVLDLARALPSSRWRNTIITMIEEDIEKTRSGMA
jgi:tetratricopeptide (TPR) repeat protein